LNNKIKINIKKINLYLLVYIGIYFVINLILLTKFPTMHSDESWLSGLTRSMMNEGVGTTEYFFDLLPRYPHAIKTIFHLMQMMFISIFGYSLFAVRLLSLFFGIISLVIFYKILVKLTNSNILSFIGMIILSLDIQFIYASHFARQEIVIIAFILAGTYYIISRVNTWSIKNDIITGCIIGLSIGIHPNSFLVALILGSVYLYYILLEKKFKLKNMAALVLTTTFFTAIFIGLSFSFNSTFINDYLKYGDNLGATSSGIMKVFTFPKYYKKLFNSFSITYYVPPIKVQFVVFALGILSGITSLFVGKEKPKALLLLLPIIALNIGYLIIGRYSQPGIVLLFPLCYLLIFLLLSKLKKSGLKISIILSILVVANTIVGVFPQTSNDYKAYIEEIQTVVPQDASVLANLNTEYAFEYHHLHDYRNLDKLNEKEFSEYIKEQDIEYIIYPEEMDFIYNNRPVFNIMYGNVFPYYDDMHNFLAENCELIYEFNSPYAMRILMYSKDKDWSVKIYKVLENDGE